MKRHVYILIALFLLCSGLYSQANVALEDDSTFITIMLHGLDRHLTWEDNPLLYEPENYEPLGERSREFGINNIFHYNFANMSRHNSNDLIREIGDFNTGSFIISEEISKLYPNGAAEYSREQPFISLARCEWVYRHSPALRKALGYAPGRDPWWLEGDEEHPESGLVKMRNLLTLGPHFADFLMVPTELDAQNKVVPMPGAFNYLISLLADSKLIIASGGLIAFSPADLEAMAKEFYQLASGNYYDDPELAASVGGNKCPSTIRIVMHSMGGMMVSRYVAETEDLFNYYNGAKGTHGFYQRNLDYTRDKFREDLGLMRDNGKKEYEKKRVEAGFSHLTPAGYEDFLYEVFKEEREISIDKIVIQDAPLAGTPLAKEVTKVVMDLAGLL